MRGQTAHVGAIPANRCPESKASVTFRKICPEGKREFGLGIPSLTQAQFCWVLLHNGKGIHYDSLSKNIFFCKYRSVCTW